MTVEAAITAIDALDVDQLRRLLACGAVSADVRDPHSDMPLLMVVIDTEMDYLLHDGDVPPRTMVEVLLEFGADPRVSWKGESALEFADRRQHWAARAALLGVLGPADWGRYRPA